MLDRFPIRHGWDRHATLCGPMAISIVTGLCADASCRMLDALTGEGWREGGGNHEGELAEVLFGLGYDIELARRPARGELAVRVVIGLEGEPHFVVAQAGRVRDWAYLKGVSRPIAGSGFGFGAGRRAGYYAICVKAAPEVDAVAEQARRLIAAEEAKGSVNVRIRGEDWPPQNRLDKRAAIGYDCGKARGGARGGHSPRKSNSRPLPSPPVF